MTFTPEVLTKTDVNNSTAVAALSFAGTSTVTTGYNTLFLTAQSDKSSAPLGIEVYFSDDNITFTRLYTDTYNAPAPYTRSYLIVKKYYYMQYAASALPTSLSITARLSTQLSADLMQSSSITVFDNSVEASQDAFGKLRVTMPQTLLDIRFPNQNVGSPEYLSNALMVATASSGTFSATYGNSKAIITGTGTGYFVSQSRTFCTYQPGKSLLALFSGIFNPGNPNFTTRVGYFQNDISVNPPVVTAGLFLSISGGVVSVNIQDASLTSVPQSSWNLDRLDGTGPSGLALDFTKAQLFALDLEWLSVGRVRFGFYAYGHVVYCHQFTHLNTLTGPYTNIINLPISYTLVGSGAGSGTLLQICATVISEGGYNPVGRPFTAFTAAETSVPLSEVPILAIRGGSSSYTHQIILPSVASIIDSTNNNTLLYRLRLYPAPLSAGTIVWTDVDTTYSVAQFATSANITGFTTTGSIIVDSAFFLGKGSNIFSSLSSSFSALELSITANIAGVSSILVMTCLRINSGTDAKVSASLSWQEIY